MAIQLNSKEYVTKCGLVEIMQRLLNKNIIEDEEVKHSFQFCIDQHNYKLAEGQENGFDKNALLDTFQTLCEAFGLDVEYEDMLSNTF